MTALTETHSLGDLAAAANREHAACEQAYGSALEHAFRAGEYLLAAKDEVAHGEWLPWLEENFLGSERMAQRYMQIVREVGDPTRVSDLPVRDVLAELAVPRVPGLPTGEEVDPEAEDAGRLLARHFGPEEVAKAREHLDAEEREREERFPRPGVERTTVRQVRKAARRAEGLLTEAVRLGRQGVRDWSCAQGLHAAARQHRDAADALADLAVVLERRAWD